jgi:hypothetical protein
LFCRTVILASEVQPGQSLIEGTRQLGLKPPPPLATASPVADTVDASNARQKIQGVRDMVKLTKLATPNAVYSIAPGP